MDDTYDPEKLVTVATWMEYSENANHHCRPLEYIEATKQFMNTIDDILSKNLSFEELKAELFQLRNEREELINFAYDKLPTFNS